MDCNNNNKEGTPEYEHEELLMKGMALFSNNLFEEATHAFNKAIKLRPEHDEAYFMNGNCACCLYKYEEGIEWYNKAIPLNPNDPEVHKNKGSALMEFHKYEEAIKSFSKSIELWGAEESEALEAIKHKASALSKIGRFNEAIELYAKAISINPNDEEALNNYGSALCVLDRFVYYSKL